jgi:hypothetical protein
MSSLYCHEVIGKTKEKNDLVRKSYYLWGLIFVGIKNDTFCHLSSKNRFKQLLASVVIARL